MQSRPPQSEATGELVENTLPAEVPYPGARDVLHTATRNCNTGRCAKDMSVPAFERTSCSQGVKGLTLESSDIEGKHKWKTRIQTCGQEDRR